jgi:hypothetical protein
VLNKDTIVEKSVYDIAIEKSENIKNEHDGKLEV